MREKPLYKFMTKGARGQSGPPQYGIHWILSRRGFLKFYADRIALGNWQIAYKNITEATIWNTGSFILEFKSADEHYQFGLNPWVKIPTDLPIKFETKNVRMRHTPASIFYRISILAFLVFLIWSSVSG